MKFWYGITLTGTAPFYLLSVALLLAFSTQTNGTTFWLNSLIPSGVAWTIASFFKKITKKKRPDTDELDAMPSSHAAASSAWACSLWFLKSEWAYFFMIWAGLIIVSRYRLKRHDVWDLFAGVILGISSAAGVYFFSKSFIF
ncbi:MAG: phosphatase PAP2 family protein [Bdellovibrionales bacterium]